MEEKTLQNTNLDLYNKFKTVPDVAKKEIKGGKLKGFTDINPMWRIEKLTEEFGICGIGWKTQLIDKWTEQGANGEVAVFTKIHLLIKINNEWSEPIEGTGGSMLVNTEQGYLRTNDEAFKMAYTDALSVACKMLGMGADVYMDKDRTKYDAESDGSVNKAKNTNASNNTSKSATATNKTKYQEVKDLINGTTISFDDVTVWLEKKGYPKQVNKLNEEQFKHLITSLKSKLGVAQ